MTKSRTKVACVTALMLAGVAACSQSTANRQGAAPASSRLDSERCVGLRGTIIEAQYITLPTSDANIIAAEWVAGADGASGHCKLSGRILPVDPSGYDILFQLNLPQSWNGRSIHFGGGGLNGQISTGEGGLRDAPPGPSPIESGYVTYGSDGGHPDLEPDLAEFFLSQEAFENHAYGAYKKTHDAAMTIVAAALGEGPTYSYFFGGSEGGREALIMAQRFPSDYDGIVAVVPALNWTAGVLHGYAVWSSAGSGGWISPEEFDSIHAATVSHCDGLDGANDGLISSYLKCAPPIDAVAPPCDAEADANSPCFTPAQSALLETMRSPFDLPFSLANGVVSTGSYGVGGEFDDRAGPSQWLVGRSSPEPGDLGRPLLGPGIVRFLVTGDPQHRGPLDLEAHRERLQSISQTIDATDPDLSEFHASGGKLILKENTYDFIVSPASVFAYYQSVKDRLGGDTVDTFVRLYVNPSVNHAGSGTKPDGSSVPDKVDLLGALEGWVEQAKPPGQLNVTAFESSGAASASRPLCQYPTYPHYSGHGDPDLATSYQCRNPE